MYYKNNSNVVLFLEEGQQVPNGFSKMLDDEIARHLNPEPSLEQLKQKRIVELKTLLASTDFRILPDYQLRSGKTDDEMQEIYVQRQAWYDELQEHNKI